MPTISTRFRYGIIAQLYSLCVWREDSWFNTVEETGERQQLGCETMAQKNVIWDIEIITKDDCEAEMCYRQGPGMAFILREEKNPSGVIHKSDANWRVVFPQATGFCVHLWSQSQYVTLDIFHFFLRGLQTACLKSIRSFPSPEQCC